MKSATSVIPPVHGQAEQIMPAKRGRGRPRVRPEGERVFGHTVRMPRGMRNALRRLAEDETDFRGGGVVSSHDLILEAIEAMLRRYRAK